MRYLVVLSSALILATACGASTSSVPTATAPALATETAADEKVVGPPDVKWSDMDPTQKGKFMKAVVMPHMKQLFVEYDPKTFAEFSCATCHGEAAKERQFKMPNPDIFVLPGDEAGFGKLMQDKPGWMKFMGEKVKPEMAKLLAVPEFDPKNPQAGGFGCFNCHTSEKK
jgi:hypothetical protein